MLINKSHVKNYALELAAQRFPDAERSVVRGGKQLRVIEPKFIQVSGDFFIYIESALKEKIRTYIAGMPTSGRTIK